MGAQLEQELAPEYCGVATGYCRNPAGFGIGVGGGHARNPNPPRTRVECSECGTPACGGCRVKRGQRWVCTYCAERDA